jgi:hypothetical protein
MGALNEFLIQKLDSFEDFLIREIQENDAFWDDQRIHYLFELFSLLFLLIFAIFVDF